MALNNPKFCQLCGAEDGKAQQELADLKAKYEILIGKHVDLKEERTALHKKIVALLREHDAVIEQIRQAIGGE